MKRSEFLRIALAGSLASSLAGAATIQKKNRKLVLIAGPPSHPPMMHEFRAGTILLEKRLAKIPGLTVVRGEMGWIEDEKALEDADAVVCFSDGNGNHPVLREKGRLETMEKLAAKGVGFGCMHFAVEVPKDTAGNQFRNMIGGCYEHKWSCNPIWEAEFETLPEHPINNGVKPFSIRDEWYFNMRFTDGFSAEGPSEIGGVRFTPVLVAKTRATRSARGPMSFRAVPMPTSRRQRAGKKPSCGRSSVPTEAAALVSPVATFTKTGRTMNSASSS